MNLPEPIPVAENVAHPPSGVATPAPHRGDPSGTWGAEGRGRSPSAQPVPAGLPGRERAPGAPHGSRSIRRRFRRLYRSPAFSPAGFLIRAAELTLFFLAAHLAGLRIHATVLSGGLSPGRLSNDVSGALGIVYIVLYFAAVVAVPILVLAALLLAVSNRCITAKDAKREETADQRG